MNEFGTSPKREEEWKRKSEARKRDAQKNKNREKKAARWGNLEQDPEEMPVESNREELKSSGELLQLALQSTLEQQLDAKDLESSN